MWQNTAVKDVNCVHATAESELNDIRDYGIVGPVAVIPNGVDVPSLLPSTVDSKGACDPFILSLGRLHPKKGLDKLIAAFSLISSAFPEWKLRIIGSDEGGYKHQLEQKIKVVVWKIKSLLSRRYMVVSEIP